MKIFNQQHGYSDVRMQFANLDSKNIWEEKIAKTSGLYSKLEYLTVHAGMRKAMIDHTAAPHTMDEVARFYGKYGLIIVPMAYSSQTSGFSHVQENGQTVYRSVVARSLADAEQFLHYHNQNDDVRIGEMLGYPTSSGEFFADIWGKGYIDPIWQQAENTKKEHIVFSRMHEQSNTIRLKEHDEYHLLNQVFRYIGVRFTSHLPRSNDDEESLEVAKAYIQVAKDFKLEGINEALDILKLPYEWDCLKGIAIVNTPVFKIVAGSTPCYPNHIVQQESNYYPKEAPNGVKFPWKMKGAMV